jgi:membrane protease YdiL (CAAX protease family)
MRPSVSVTRRPVLVGVALEAALFGVSLLLGPWWAIHPLNGLQLRAATLLAGLLLTLPPVTLLAVTLRSGRPWAVRLRHTVDDIAATLLPGTGPLALLVLAAAAGVAEETLFRGVLQAAIAPHLGNLVAVVVVGALFGAAHAISAAYVLVATGMGLYLGAVYAMTGNLILPVVIHTTYDCLALLVFRHRVRARHRACGHSAGDGTEL